MSIRKRAKGIYHYRFEIAGREFSGSTETPDKREAERVESRARREAQEQVRSAAAPAGLLTFGKAVDKFWNERGTRYTGSYRATIWTALEWLKAEIGDNTPLRDIGPLQVNDAIGRRRAEGVSNATINRTVIELLRRIFIRARDKWGVTTLQRIEWELEPEPKERVRSLAVAEESALAANMRADYMPAIKFAMLTGARKASVVALKKVDVDICRVGASRSPARATSATRYQ
jgi:integrase